MSSFGEGIPICGHQAVGAAARRTVSGWGGPLPFVNRAPDRQECAFHGEYREVDRPRRLVSTSVYEGAQVHEAPDAVTFEQSGDGTWAWCTSRHSTLAAQDFYGDVRKQRGPG